MSTIHEKMVKLQDLYGEFKRFNSIKPDDFLPFEGAWGSVRAGRIDNLLHRRVKYSNEEWKSMDPINRKYFLGEANNIYRILMKAKRGDYSG